MNTYHIRISHVDRSITNILVSAIDSLSAIKRALDDLQADKALVCNIEIVTIFDKTIIGG